MVNRVVSDGSGGSSVAVITNHDGIGGAYIHGQE